MKYNKKEAERLFRIFAKRMGKEIGYNEGQWELNSAHDYGGYVIYEYGKYGGSSHLFGGRLPCREFCKAIEFALDVLNYKENQK